MSGVTPAEVLSNFGLTLVEDHAENQPRLLVDLPAAELVEHAIRRNEGRMASNGALVIETGERTGRSPNDRFIVDTPDVHDRIAWGAVNRPLSVESYEAIKSGVVDYLNERDVFVTRGMAGADGRSRPAAAKHTAGSGNECSQLAAPPERQQQFCRDSSLRYGTPAQGNQRNAGRPDDPRPADDVRAGDAGASG